MRLGYCSLIRCQILQPNAALERLAHATHQRSPAHGESAPSSCWISLYDLTTPSIPNTPLRKDETRWPSGTAGTAVRRMPALSPTSAPAENIFTTAVGH